MVFKNVFALYYDKPDNNYRRKYRLFDYIPRCGRHQMVHTVAIMFKDVTNMNAYCHVFRSDYRRVLGWWPDLLQTYTTRYYTSQIMSSQSVTDFTSRCLVTDVSTGYSSASVLRSRTEFCQLSTELGTRLAAISHQLPSLLSQADFELNCPFNWTLSLTKKLFHDTSLNWTDNWLGPRLVTISHKPPILLFTGWHSTELQRQLSSR
jgi:hypothetical protein